MTVEHHDEYGQRYITTKTQTKLGTEYTTETYTPYIYGQPTTTRKTGQTLEAYGIITITTQVYNHQNQLIAQGTETQTDWIEINKPCTTKPKNNFKYNLNNPLTTTTQTQITLGPALVPPNDPNNTIWPRLNPDGTTIPPGTGETNLQIINIWN